MTTIPPKPKYKKRNLIRVGAIASLLLVGVGVIAVQAEVDRLESEMPNMVINGFAENESDYHSSLPRMRDEWSEALQAANAEAKIQMAYSEYNVDVNAEESLINPTQSTAATVNINSTVYFDSREEAEAASLAIFNYYVSEGRFVNEPPVLAYEPKAELTDEENAVAAADFTPSYSFYVGEGDYEFTEEELNDEAFVMEFIANFGEENLSSILVIVQEDKEDRWTLMVGNSSQEISLLEIPKFDGNLRTKEDVENSSELAKSAPDVCPAKPNYFNVGWDAKYGCPDS